MNITKTAELIHFNKKTMLKNLIWLGLITLPFLIQIGLNRLHTQEAHPIKHSRVNLAFLDEHIAYLINKGHTYQQLKGLGYSKQQIISGFQELISSRSPIPTVAELKELGLNEQHIIHNAANLIVQENLSVYDLDDMGFKDRGLIPKVINVLVHQFHFSNDELEGVGFTPNEIHSSMAS